MRATLGTRSPTLPVVGTFLSLAGAGLLALAAVLPQQAPVMLPNRTPAAGSLWWEGTGWMCVAGALVVAALTLRARTRSDWSWVGLWVGALAVLNAGALARDDAFRPVGAGVATLAVAGVVLLAGWAVGFAAVRPRVRGLGRLRELPEQIRRARPPAAPARPAARATWWPLAVYAGLSLAFWGWPLRHGFDSNLIAADTIDPSVYTWFYAWWPHAVFHGLNPFTTHVIFVPDGYNLTWVTAVPGPSMLAAPLTLTLGPVVAFNVLALAAPPITAWSAYLLCRHLTGAVAPSLVGGYLFGFSPFVLRMLQGSPHLYFLALVPLIVLLVIRRLEGSLGERAFFVALTLCVAGQYLTSVDVLATLTVFGAIGLGLAFWLFVERRALVLRTAGVIACAYAGAAVLLTPVLFHMLLRSHTTPEQNTPFLANDLVSWVVPDSSLLVATTHRMDGTPPQYGGLSYLGVPLIALVALYAWRNWRERGTRLVALCFAIPMVMGLGQRLTVDGTIRKIGAPWSAVDHLPGLHLLVPQRFPLYAFLAGAVIASLWLARGSDRRRWALGLLAVVAILPYLWAHWWKVPLDTPSFFTSGAYRAYLRPDDHVLTTPMIGDNMRWQAEEEFGFELAGGGVGAFPESYTRYPAFGMLVSGQLTPNYGKDLRDFVAAKRVTAVVVDKRFLSPDRRRLFATLGVRPIDTGGVLLYRLPRS